MVRRGAPSSAPPLLSVEVGGSTSGVRRPLRFILRRRPLESATGYLELGGWFHLSYGFIGVYLVLWSFGVGVHCVGSCSFDGSR